MKLLLALAPLAVVALSPNVATATPPNDSIYACAYAASDELDTRNFQVVKLTTRSGRDNYGVWLDVAGQEARAYCDVRAGDVVMTYVDKGHWPRTRMGRPHADDVTAG